MKGGSTLKKQTRILLWIAPTASSRLCVAAERLYKHFVGTGEIRPQTESLTFSRLASIHKRECLGRSVWRAEPASGLLAFSGVLEEFIYRGFIIEELGELIGSRRTSAVVSVLFFALDS
jgi:membrane protease YdiL (CAAX protease family)